MSTLSDRIMLLPLRVSQWAGYLKSNEESHHEECCEVTLITKNCEKRCIFFDKRERKG
jgi:hypothetical protein